MTPPSPGRGDTHRLLLCPPVRVLVFALSAEVGAAPPSPSTVGVAGKVTVAGVSVRRPLGSPTPAPPDGGVLSYRAVSDSNRGERSCRYRIKR